MRQELKEWLSIPTSRRKMQFCQRSSEMRRRRQWLSKQKKKPSKRNTKRKTQPKSKSKRKRKLRSNLRKKKRLKNLKRTPNPSHFLSGILDLRPTKRNSENSWGSLAHLNTPYYVKLMALSQRTLDKRTQKLRLHIKVLVLSNSLLGNQHSNFLSSLKKLRSILMKNVETLDLRKIIKSH